MVKVSSLKLSATKNNVYFRLVLRQEKDAKVTGKSKDFDFGKWSDWTLDIGMRLRGFDIWHQFNIGFMLLSTSFDHSSGLDGMSKEKEKEREGDKKEKEKERKEKKEVNGKESKDKDKVKDVKEKDKTKDSKAWEFATKPLWTLLVLRCFEFSLVYFNIFQFVYVYNCISQF